MTNKQLRDRVVKEIGLQDITDYDETTMVNDFIYDGIVDILARTRCTVRCIHMKTQADEAQYTLDRSILALVDVEDGRSQKLRRGENGTGYTLVRSDVLLLDPTPTEDGEIDVWAVVRPGKMTGDNDSRPMPFGASPTSTTTRSSSMPPGTPRATPTTGRCDGRATARRTRARTARASSRSSSSW